MVGQLQLADLGVPQPLGAVVADADVVRGPLAAELGTDRGQLADEFAQGPVLGFASGFRAQQCGGGDGGGLPVDEELPECSALVDRFREGT